MKNSTQLNINIDQEWRKKLEKRAFQESFSKQTEITVADLVRRSICDTYNLNIEYPIIKNYTDKNEYFKAIEEEQHNPNRVCIYSDDPNFAVLGLLCYDLGTDAENYTLHRWYVLGEINKEPTEIIEYDNYADFRNYMVEAKNLNYTIMPADNPRKLEFGYTILETYKTHVFPLKFLKFEESNDFDKWKKLISGEKLKQLITQ